ncbi:MAG: hypothetical protein OEZ52_14810 [Candidatus Aminicenantes bacterium]|nr:hypothetical protein [Candidatus Aminicenantes bacterium]
MNTEPSSGEGDPLGQWLSAIDLKNNISSSALGSAQYSPLLPRQGIRPNDIVRYLGKYRHPILRFDKTKSSP